jgi:hypothetical protein
MTRIVVHSEAGPDGVFHLDVPLGSSGASRQVRVIVEDVVPEPAPGDREEWYEFIRRTAGTWQGEFERPAQGEFVVMTSDRKGC